MGLASAPLTLQNILTVWREDLVARAEKLYMSTSLLKSEKGQGQRP